MKTQFLKFICAAIMLFITNLASAGIITFDGLGNANRNGTLNYDGFTFTAGLLFTYGNLNSSRYTVSKDASDYLMFQQAQGSNNNYAPLNMSRIGGGVFALNGFDLSQFYTYAAINGSFSVVGHKQGGGTVSTLFTPDSINDGIGPLDDFESFSLVSAYDSLVSVDFIFDLGNTEWQYLVLDNIVVDESFSSVPEPSTLAIFALGMIGLASRRMKKQS
jgi:hypothetical protein